MDLRWLVLALFAGLAAMTAVPSAAADPICGTPDSFCVGINEDTGEGGCAEFCLYVYIENPITDSYWCTRLTVHDRWVCSTDITIP